MQHKFLPGELLTVFSDVSILNKTLKIVDNWWCVLVNNLCVAKKLGQLIEKTGQSVRYYENIDYLLARLVRDTTNHQARYLGIKDFGLMKESQKELQGAGFKNIKELLIRGIIAGVIINKKLVSISHTFAITEKYADVGTYTLKHYRARGYSTITATLVCSKLQKRGIMPVWGTGKDNRASKKVAEKLGFHKINSNFYVIKT